MVESKFGNSGEMPSRDELQSFDAWEGEQNVNTPNNEGQLVTIVGDASNTWTILYDKLVLAGVILSVENIQLDGSPGGDPSGTPAPEGKLYAWVTVVEGAGPLVLSAVQGVLDSM